jgi:hypothetical protein
MLGAAHARGAATPEQRRGRLGGQVFQLSLLRARERGGPRGAGRAARRKPRLSVLDVRPARVVPTFGLVICGKEGARTSQIRSERAYIRTSPHGFKSVQRASSGDLNP